MLPLYYARIPYSLPNDTVVFHISLGEIDENLSRLEQPPLTPQERRSLVDEFWDKHYYDQSILEELVYTLREGSWRALSTEDTEDTDVLVARDHCAS